MPINKTLTTPNGAAVAFHRIRKIEFVENQPMANVVVGSWSDLENYLLRPTSPVWNWQAGVPIGYFTGAPVECAELALLQDGDFSGGVQLAAVDPESLDARKARVRESVNTWRLRANRTTFDFLGQEISCDELSRSDIEGVSGWVSLTGTLPPDFPGAWKTLANSYVSIPDVPTWIQFFGAMVAQGTVNFARSQALKELLSLANTPEEVDAIHWNMTLPVL